MWLLYLYTLLTFGSVRTLTIGYPYRTLLNYDSNQSLAKVIIPPGYLIYLDNSGIERIVSFNYAEPVYAVRRINFVNNERPVDQNFELDESSEAKEAREAHFRAWSLHQYLALKREIDFLRGEGKEPLTEMALKFLPLEKIALSHDYTTISDLPEIQRVRDEHLKIWKQIVQTDKLNTKSAIDNSEKISSVEIEMKNKANKDQQLKHLEMQLNYSQNHQDIIGTTQIYDKFLKHQLYIDKGLDQLNSKKPEDEFTYETDTKKEIATTEKYIEISDPLKLALEGKELNSTVSRIDKGNLEKFKHEIKKVYEPLENLSQQTDKTSATEAKQIFNFKSETGSESESKQGDRKYVQGQKSHFVNTPELSKYHKDAPSLVLEGNLQKYAPPRIHSELEMLISDAPTIYVPQQVTDTAEVMHARDEHLKIVNDAIEKSKLAQLHDKQKKTTGKQPTIAWHGPKDENTPSTLKDK